MTYKSPPQGRYDRRLNTTNYDHPQETNLLDVHRAMEYNAAGEPVLRTSLNPTLYDAFGRLRVAAPFTLFDSFHRYQDNGKVSESLSGTATSVHDPNSSSILLTIGSASGDRAYRETSRVFAYQPGKSMKMLITFTLSEARTGLRNRIGLFDTSNGIFLQRDGGTISLVRRSSSTGVVVDTVVPQSNWNGDRFDGTGSSTLTLDLTKSQIFFCDIEWLGVGTVRCGFVIDGEFHVVHSFHHANTGTSTYMGTACLPGRVEIENTASTTGSSTHRQICFSVVSEGGYELRGRPFSLGHSLSAPYRIAAPNTFYPLLSIRLKSTRSGAIVIPKNFSISVTAAANFRYQILNGAVTSGGTWVSAGTNSSVEYNLTATTISNGSVLETGYIISSNQASTSPSLADFPFKYQLERNTFIPTFYEFVIAMETSGNNQDVFASINWEEIT